VIVVSRQNEVKLSPFTKSGMVSNMDHLHRNIRVLFSCIFVGASNIGFDNRDTNFWWKYKL